MTTKTKQNWVSDLLELINMVNEANSIDQLHVISMLGRQMATNYEQLTKRGDS